MEAGIQSYRDLKVWQEAMALTEQCYRTTQRFPKEEMFGLTAQIRRATASIPANIAESYGRETKDECVQFFHIAQDSLKELETYLLLANRVGLLAQCKFETFWTDVKKWAKCYIGSSAPCNILSNAVEHPTYCPSVHCLIKGATRNARVGFSRS